MEPVHPNRALSGFRPGVAFAVVMAVLLGDASLRAGGLELPRLVPFLGPAGSPATLITLFLAVRLALRRRRSGADGAAAARMAPNDLLPLALAVFGMGAILECAAAGVRLVTTPPAVSPALSGPLYRLGMGGALLAFLGGLVWLVPRFRRRLRDFASPRRLRSGLYFTVAVVAVVYAVLLWLGVAMAGPGMLRVQIPVLIPGSIALVFGQLAIALGEEAFYRGLLQREVGGLLRRAGLVRHSDRRLASIGAVSILFAFQHVDSTMPSLMWTRVFLYSFVMSLLLGFLFDVTRNIAVCAFAHLFNNLTVLKLGPVLAAPGSIDAFGAGVYIVAYLLVAFSLLFLLGRDSSPSLEPIRPDGP